MHAVSHSLAHRAPPATRTRTRWQPYNSIQSSRSPSTYLNTPVSLVSTSPSPSHTFAVSEPERRRIPPSSASEPHRDGLRDVQKSKYVIGLVDQAVKSLCDIWHPHDIPAVFLTSSRPVVISASNETLLPAFSKPAHLCTRNSQLPSPISPSTHPIPISPPVTSSPVAARTQQYQQNTTCAQVSRSNLVPIKGFVHEVLRRSRTSGSVLQTALCYLEAVRAKIPELVRQEKLGKGVRGEPESGNRIVQGEVDAEDGVTVNSLLSADSTRSLEDVMDTVRLHDSMLPEATSSFSQPAISVAQQGSSKKPKAPSAPLPPLPPLPSPLLCPRRTFLASLILASKFMQDRCYSNRAWAKLSGLPPREIGRCERALGDALEWRLWVGKTPAPVTSAGTHGRPVVRSKSEGDLFPGPRTASEWQASTISVSRRDLVPAPLPADCPARGLRRSSTLPISNFRSQDSDPSSSSSSVPLPMLGSDTLMYATPTPSIPYATDVTAPIDSWSGSILSSRHLESQGQSPSPPTPTLSFSPTSTESSSGDRTIQMSSFIDVPTTPLGQFAPLVDKVSPPEGGMAPYAYTAHHAAIDPASDTMSYSFPNAYEGSSVAMMYPLWTM